MTEDVLLIRSADRQAWCRLTLREQIDDPYGWDSAVVDVEAEVYGFAGDVENVYIQRDVLKQFASDMVRFEQTRKGLISLYNTGVSDATNEFGLQLEARSGGHAMVRVELLRI